MAESTALTILFSVDDIEISSLEKAASISTTSAKFFYLHRKLPTFRAYLFYPIQVNLQSNQATHSDTGESKYFFIRKKYNTLITSSGSER